MKLRYLMIFLSVLAMSSNSNATEIYNQDGSKIDLFGQLTGLHYLSHDHNVDGDKSNISYGVYAETQLNDKLNLFGICEYKSMIHSSIKNTLPKSNKISLGYAGINIGEHERIDFGKNFGIMHDIGLWTSQSQEFGRNISCIDSFYSSKSVNVLTYRNDNFFNLIKDLSIAIQYQGKNHNSYSNIHGEYSKEFSGHGYGLSMVYNFRNGIYTGLSYTKVNSKRNKQNLHIEEKHSKNSKAYSIGIKYEIDNAYLALLCGENNNFTPFGNKENRVSLNNIYGLANKVRNLEFLAQYESESGLSPSVGYVYSQWKDKNSKEKQKLKEYVEIGTNYIFNKNVTAFINYKINLLKSNYFLKASSISTNNIVSLGMSYIF